MQNFIKHSTCVLKFVKMKQEFHVKQKFCLVNSYRNTISKWALGFRYRNFFIPRVEKNLKISPWEGNSCLPRAYGPWEERVSSLGLIFGGFFQPLGWRNFHTWNPAHSEILYSLTEVMLMQLHTYFFLFSMYVQNFPQSEFITRP